MRMAVEESLRGHDEARRAVSALLGVMIDEGGGHRMRLRGRADAFDGMNFLALRIDGEDSAAVDHLPAEDDRAGAAGGAVADALGAGHIEAVAKRVAECHARLDGQALFF